MMECPVCSLTLKDPFRMPDDYWYCDCLRCGKYLMTRTAEHVLKQRLEGNPQRLRLVANVSGWLRRNHEIRISTSLIDSLIQTRTPTFHERADLLLAEMEKRTGYAGQLVEIDSKLKPEWLTIAYCINAEEFSEILSFLEAEERIETRKIIGPPLQTKILPRGWSHLAKMRELNPESSLCFVAMSFSPEMRRYYDEGFATAIKAAGYKPHRVDDVEHVGKIDDRIIADIKKSRFVVADFSEHKGGVYFEAGFAMGLGLPVVWTCKKDHLNDLHFDIRQYNCIDWEDTEDLIKRLQNRIEAAIGRGRHKENH